jgi:exoribonuclease II
MFYVDLLGIQVFSTSTNLFSVSICDESLIIIFITKSGILKEKLGFGINNAMSDKTTMNYIQHETRVHSML